MATNGAAPVDAHSASVGHASASSAFTPSAAILRAIQPLRRLPRLPEDPSDTLPPDPHQQPIGSETELGQILGWKAGRLAVTISPGSAAALADCSLMRRYSKCTPRAMRVTGQKRAASPSLQ